MRFLARAFAYLYETAVSLFLIVLSVLAMTGDVNQFRLPMLPWEGATLAYAVLTLGILGIAAVLLALTRRLRAALPVWALVVLILMVRGWFASSYTFANSSAFQGAAWVTFGALLAFVCSFFVAFRRDY
jgi:hypothetical protein